MADNHFLSPTVVRPNTLLYWSTETANIAVQDYLLSLIRKVESILRTLALQKRSNLRMFSSHCLFCLFLTLYDRECDKLIHISF